MQFFPPADQENYLNDLNLQIDTDNSIPIENLISGVQDVEGDGTVPLISTGFMGVAGWRTTNPLGRRLNPGNVEIINREYFHEPTSLVKDPRGGPKTADHVDILGNFDLTLDILKIVCNEASEITDKTFSDISQYSQNILESLETN